MSFSRMLPGSTFVSLPGMGRLKVREAAGVFFVLAGNGKDGRLELVVAKLLERHRGRDGGKDGDVCREARAQSENIPISYSLFL